MNVTITARSPGVPTNTKSHRGESNLADTNDVIVKIGTEPDFQEFTLSRAQFEAYVPTAGMDVRDRTWDDAEFTLESSVPADAATDQLATVNIVLTFSEDVDPATVTDETIVIEADAVAKPGVFTVADEVVTFNPTDNFAAADVVTVVAGDPGPMSYHGIEVTEIDVSFTVAA